jgi:Golgi nucleoside diphosphatase
MKLKVSPASHSPSDTARYVTVLDAGSSGTRIFVYKWDTAGGADGFRVPLKIKQVFPLPDENDVDIKPGFFS